MSFQEEQQFLANVVSGEECQFSRNSEGYSGEEQSREEIIDWQLHRLKNILSQVTPEDLASYVEKSLGWVSPNICIDKECTDLENRKRVQEYVREKFKIVQEKSLDNAEKILDMLSENLVMNNPNTPHSPKRSPRRRSGSELTV